jgi:hypothetical protein
MYESIGYETYSESKALKNGKEGHFCCWDYKRGFEAVYEWKVMS